MAEDSEAIERAFSQQAEAFEDPAYNRLFTTDSHRLHARRRRTPALPGRVVDVVVSRFAVHHFERPAEQIAEMRRCLRMGGRLAIGDLIADPDGEVAAFQNRLERLRDPSHTKMLSLEALAQLVGSTADRLPPARGGGPARLPSHGGLDHRVGSSQP